MTPEIRNQWLLDLAGRICAELCNGMDVTAVTNSPPRHASRAAFAMNQASALLVEYELHKLAEAELFPDGEVIDKRASDPHCMHGISFKDDCPLCTKGADPAPNTN